MGAVELGAEKHYVCGPPLDKTRFPERCQEASVDAALDNSLPGDIIVISGVVTEKVAIDKNIYIRGPSRRRRRPARRWASCSPDEIDPGSVITVSSGISVTIGWLNIRNGNASQGGGILNHGELALLGVTLFDNQATAGGAIYNNGKLTVADSTLTENSVTNAANGSGIHNVVRYGERQLQHLGQFRNEHLQRQHGSGRSEGEGQHPRRRRRRPVFGCDVAGLQPVRRHLPQCDPGATPIFQAIRSSASCATTAARR